MISPLRRILFDHFLFNLHLLLTSILYIYSGYILTENISKIWKEMESDLDGRESKEESEVHLEGMTNGRLDFYWYNLSIYATWPPNNLCSHTCLSY